MNCGSTTTEIFVQTYRIVSSQGDGEAGVQTVGEVQDLGDLLGAAVDAEGAEAGSETASVARQTYPLALEGAAADVRDQAGEAAPDAGAGHDAPAQVATWMPGLTRSRRRFLVRVMKDFSTTLSVRDFS